jgi:hypothetical protein
VEPEQEDTGRDEDAAVHHCDDRLAAVVFVACLGVMNRPCCTSSSSERSIAPETMPAIAVPMPMIGRIVTICARRPSGR